MSDTQQQSQENHHQRQRLLVTLFTLSMISLLIIAVIFIAPEIEKDLNRKITEQLEKKGITASVSLSGRDAILSGYVNNNSEIQKAQDSTTHIVGIHFLDNQLVVNNKQSSVQNSSPPPITTIPTNTKQDTKPLQPTTPENVVSPSSKIEIEETTNKTSTTSTTQNSSQAYEKILAAMSRYNEIKKTNLQDSVNNKKPTNKIPFDFDTSRIKFKKNSSILTTNAKKSLTALAKKLKQSAKTLEISVRSKESKLAFEQAKKIRQYLVTQGIKKKTLIIRGINSNTKNTTVTIVERKKLKKK